MTRPSRRDVIAFAASLVAGSAAGQTAATTPVALETPLGRLVFALETQRAPITAGNFLAYVDRKLYDGASFYRASRPAGSVADDFGFVQGGQSDPRKLLAPIPHESTLQTGLRHVNGTISMARTAPGTAQADWIICLGEQGYLDADPDDPAKLGFAAFGQVVEGLEIARKILVAPTDPTKGEGAMRGEMLAAPVPILTARRA